MFKNEEITCICVKSDIRTVCLHAVHCLTEIQSIAIIMFSHSIA